MNVTTVTIAQLHATPQEAAEALEYDRWSDGMGLQAPDRQSMGRVAFLVDDPTACATACLRYSNYQRYDCRATTLSPAVRARARQKEKPHGQCQRFRHPTDP